MSGLRERIVLDGQRLDARVDERVTGARLRRGMEMATSLELTLSDPNAELLRSDVLSRPGRPSRGRDTRQGKKKPLFVTAAWDRVSATQLELDGAFFRLAGISPNYDESTQELTLTFEDMSANLLRRHRGPLKSSRGEMTRARFVLMLLREVELIRIPWIIPELDEKQRIRGDLPEQRKRAREKGFPDGKRLGIQGDQWNSEQRRNLETGLAVADELKAGERATLALIVAYIQESKVMNLPYGDADSQGILQLRVGIHGLQAARSVEQCTRLFLTKGFWGKGGAISIASEHPDFTPGQIAQQVQGSGYPAAYDPWVNEAEDILEAWGGAGRAVVKRRRYEFQRAKDENSFDCIRRHADEVRWRAWFDENACTLATDEWLFQNRPVTTIRPDTVGLRGWKGDVDVGLPASELEFTVRIPRWVGRPGDCVELDGFGLFDGRWLVWEIDLDLLTENGTVLIRRPAPALPEPAPDKEKLVLTETAPERGSVRARILQGARLAVKRRQLFRYDMGGRSAAGLFKQVTEGRAPISEQPVVTGYAQQTMDCSLFATMVYKYAGAPDPNNASYRGAMFTGSLWANGEKTSDPQPGDLVFFGANPAAAGGASHVGVYVGDGEMIDLSSSSGVSRRKVWKTGTPPFAGYRTYDLGG